MIELDTSTMAIGEDDELDGPAEVPRPPARWLIPDMLPAPAVVSTLVAPGAEAAATLLLLDTAARLAAEAPWAGTRSAGPCRVAYIDPTHRAGIGSAVRSIEKHSGIDTAGRLRLVRGSLAIGDRSSVARLIATLRPEPPDIIVIDPVTAALNGRPLDDDHVPRSLRRIKRELNATVIAVLPHHAADEPVTTSATAVFSMAWKGRRITLSPRRVPVGSRPRAIVFDLLRTPSGIVPVATADAEGT